MGTRILVVDDEETLRTVIGEVLGDDGHEVSLAPNAERALEMFEDQPFPLVITDIIMGSMSGLELLEKVKTIDPETLVVVMTSHASLETAMAAIRSGAYDFLIKPFDELDMISAVVNRATEKIDLIHDNRNLMQRMKDYAVELEALNRKLKAMANRDGLTGLYNRRFFGDAVDVELERSRRHGHEFSLIFMDIDYFKNYNDTHGHLAGDEALTAVAGVLSEFTRKTTIAARYGGEEFVLLVPETNRDGARILAEKIRSRIESEAFAGQESQPNGTMTLSLGIAEFPSDAEGATELIDRADRALYKAKSLGRNRVVDFSEIGEETPTLAS